MNGEEVSEEANTKRGYEWRSNEGGKQHTPLQYLDELPEDEDKEGYQSKTELS